MDKIKALIDLNSAINTYFERQSIEAGNARYWPQVFVTSEMLDDEDLVKSFAEVFGSTINKVETIKGEANGRYKKANVAGLSK